MKKTAKYIIIMLVVLAVLGGAALLLMNLPQADSGEGESSSQPSSPETEKESVMAADPSDVKEIVISNSEGSFTLLPVRGSGSDTGDFTLEDYDKQYLNTSAITANARSLLGISASKNLGGRDDLDAFGLGKDAATATVTYNSGESDHLTFGTDAGESVGKYVLKDGNVYIVSGLPANFYGSKFAYFNPAVYSVPDRMEVTEDEDGNTSESQGLDMLYEVTLSGAHFPEPVSAKVDSSTISGYVITSPVTAETGNTAFNELIDSLKSLTASSVADARITDELLEEYGLLEPDARIKFNLNDSRHTLAVSAKNSDGYRYLIADDKDLIYRVTNDSVSKWAETGLSQLRMSYIWIPNIKNVEKLKLTVEGDQVHEYHITRTVNEEKSTESNTQYDLAIEDAAGSAVDYDEAYQPFYQKLISLAVFVQDVVEYRGTPDVKVEYSYFGGGGDTVELYKVKDQNRYAALLNGEFNGQVRGTEVSAMLELIP